MTTVAAQAPRFSVVIASRNRHGDLARAVASVQAQRGARYELIVVDDGSDDPVTLADAATVPPGGPLRRELLRLRPRTRGHGPAFARNEGVALARGDYIAFLDDDDVWTDPEHLARCDALLANRHDAVDACFARQAARQADGQAHPGPLWLDGLAPHLSSPTPDGDDHHGVHTVTPEQLLQVDGFAHLNTTLYRADFFRQLGGFDESLRYEEDRDLYLRALDNARGLLFLDRVIALHHIPQATQGDSASSRLGALDRHLMRLRWCDRLLLSAQRPAVRHHARTTKAYALKNRAMALRALGQAAAAQHCMREALACQFSFGWLLYTLWAGAQGRFARRPEST